MKELRIAVDGVFFQFNSTGIARLWRVLLSEWVRLGLGRNVLFFDRESTGPSIVGIESLVLPRFSYMKRDEDAEMLGDLCHRNKVDVFLSSYYTIAKGVPSLQLVYDMIPERMGFDLSQPQWVAKTASILASKQLGCISDSTKRDLVLFHNMQRCRDAIVLPLGVEPVFFRRSSERIVILDCDWV